MTWQRMHAACATIAWCAALNALWFGFTLLGGVVFGLGPATVTASILTRRRMRGEAVGLRAFAVVWRSEFLRGNVVMLPAIGVIGLLAGNYGFFSALGPEASAPRLATLVALVLAIGVASYLPSMYAHYDLPLWAYIGKAARFCLARLAATILLLFVLSSLIVICALVPPLLATIGIGAWLHVSTWICVRLFQENEDRLPAAGPHHTEPARPLPAEPLRLH